MLDEPLAIMAVYLGIGFLSLIAVFLIRGPQQTWFDLTGANPALMDDPCIIREAREALGEAQQ